MILLTLAAAMTFSCMSCGSGDKSPLKEAIETYTGPHLNIRISDAVTSLDPHNWSTDSEFTVISQIYEPLYRLADDTAEIPVLATGYTIAEDGLSCTFTIRDDVCFSNGDALTVEDIKYSIERQLTDSDIITSVEVNSEEFLVTLHLAAPAPGIIADISTIPIISRTFAEEHGKENGSLGYSSCGTGPYVYARHVSGESITLTANPLYYGEPAAIETLNFLVIPDESEAIRLLQNGSLDIAGISSDSKKLLADDASVKTKDLPQNHVTFLVINTEKPPFDNKYIRRAISCSVNKEVLNLETQQGSAVTADSMATPYMPGYSDIDPKYAYDLIHTRQLLNGCGYLDKLDIGEIQVLTDSYLSDIGAILQEQLDQADILATITELTAEELFNNCMNGNFGIALMVQTNTFDMNWLSTYYSSEYIGGLNMARYSDPELDMLLSRAAVCTDPERRTALYNEILIEAEKSCAYIPIYNRSICHAWAADLDYTPTVHTPIYSGCSRR